MDSRNIIRKIFLLGLTPFCPLLKRKKGYAVLMYHRIVEDDKWEKEVAREICVRRSDFAKQMAFIKKNGEVLALGEMVARISNHIEPEVFSVAVSFDDGYADNFTLAGPVLKKYGLKATIFVTPGYVEDNSLIPYWDKLIRYAKKNNGKLTLGNSQGDEYNFDLGSLEGKRNFFSVICAWDYQNPEFTPKLMEKIEDQNHNFLGEQNDFFSWELLKEAITSGNYEIGCHTLTHPVLGLLPDFGEKEMQESKSALEQKLSQSVKLFSYPLGGAHVIKPEVISQVKKMGFQAAFTNEIGINSARDNLYLMKRIAVLGGEGLWEFQSKLYAASLLKWLLAGKK